MEAYSTTALATTNSIHHKYGDIAVAFHHHPASSITNSKTSITVSASTLERSALA